MDINRNFKKTITINNKSYILRITQSQLLSITKVNILFYNFTMRFNPVSGDNNCAQMNFNFKQYHQRYRALNNLKYPKICCGVYNH